MRESNKTIQKHISFEFNKDQEKVIFLIENDFVGFLMLMPT